MSVRKSLAWMGLAQILSFSLQFATSVVLARHLTPYDTGIYAVALATTGALSLIQALGLQALIVREKALTDEVSTTAFTVNAMIAVVLSAIIAATSVGGGVFLRDPGVQKVMLVLAINPLFGIFSFLPASNLERNGRFKAMALIATSASTIAAVITIGLALQGFSYMSIAYAQLTSGLASVIMMNVVGYKHARFRLGLKEWRRIGDFGFQMFAVSGVNAISSRLSDVILGRMLGLSALGIYNRASGLNGLIWNNIHLVIGRVMFVDYAAIQRQGLPIRDRYIRTVEIMTAVLWPAFAGLAILSKPLILNVYGKTWVPAALPLAFLAIGSIIQVAITMTWELFAVTGQLRTQTRIEFWRAIASIIAFSIGCMISIQAAAAARVIDSLIALFVYRPHLDRMTGTSVSDFWSVYARSGILTLLAVLPAALVMAYFKMSALVPIWIVGLAVAAGLIFWIIGLWLFKHPLIEEIRNRSKNRAAAQAKL